jgi:urease accessory protein
VIVSREDTGHVPRQDSVPPKSSTVRGYAGLVFERRASRTVLAHSRVEAPMTVIRPFELPDGRLVVQLISLGPGLCGGDAMHVEITAGDGAHVVVTTTAATRVMTMGPGEHAEQHVRLEAGQDASLEYYPAVTIPFPGSALVQTVRATAVPSARVGVIEAWALGRTARDEYLQFRSLSSRTTLHAGGALAYADAMQIDPASTDATNAGILARRRYVASGFWYGARLPAGSANDGEYTDPPSEGGTLVAFAQSTPDLVYLRALGDDAPAVDAVLRRSVERVSDGWGLPAVHLNRFHC